MALVMYGAVVFVAIIAVSVAAMRDARLAKAAANAKPE